MSRNEASFTIQAVKILVRTRRSEDDREGLIEWCAGQGREDARNFKMRNEMNEEKESKCEGRKEFLRKSTANREYVCW